MSAAVASATGVVVVLGLAVLVGGFRAAAAPGRGILVVFIVAVIIIGLLAGGPVRSIAAPAALLAAAGFLLRWLGLRWAMWLVIPLAMVVSLSILTRLGPLVPVGLVVLAAIAAPIVLAVVVLKGLQGLVSMLFGRGVASRVVASEIIRMIGASGRVRVRPMGQPELPRPRRPFDPRHLDRRL